MGSAQGFTGDMPRGPASQAPPDMDMGAMPTGPRGDSTSAPVPGRGGRAGGGWRADFEFEAEVSSMHPNLSVKLIGCDAAQSASVRGGGWRVDKLANRTSFVRQLTAIQDMMEVKQGTSQKQGVDAKIRDVLVAGWDGNKQARDSIPDMCAEEKLSTSGLNVIQRQKVIDQAMDLQAMSHMNKSQTDALEAALFQRVTLIQGKYFPFTTFRRLIAHTRLTLFFYNQAAQCSGKLAAAAAAAALCKLAQVRAFPNHHITKD